MNEQILPPFDPSVRPTTDDRKVWQDYWQQKGQPWRTEPEITTDRQDFLANRLTIKPGIEKGVYPFKGIKLGRADVEWLLDNHENGRGPIDWNDKSQRSRVGLDIRGADLSQENLSGLPLACLHGGLNGDEWSTLSEEEDKLAVVLMNEVNLTEAHLEGALLRGAQLKKASIFRAYLESADLVDADLSQASLSWSHLEGTRLSGAHLEGAHFSGSFLNGASLYQANLKDAILHGAYLERADLSEAFLEEADLSWAKLKNANLNQAQLQGANLRWADLEGVNFSYAILNDQKGIGPFCADAQWGTANLSLIVWTSIAVLGDEYRARQKYEYFSTQRKSIAKRLEEHEIAVRANRQVSVALQTQGLNEHAARFAYQAQVLQQEILWMQLGWGNWIQKMIGVIRGHSLWKGLMRLSWWRILRLLKWKLERSSMWKWWFGSQKWLYKRFRRLRNQMRKLAAFLFSFFFGILAGYGYRPGRAIIWYLTVILGFAIIYTQCGPLRFFPDALVFSIMSFHGRGFFPSLNGQISLHNALVVSAALEAIVGLIIEASFIATFTQRFFKG